VPYWDYSISDHYENE